MEAIPLFKVAMDPVAGELVSRVLSSGYIGQGPQVEEFETQLQPWTGQRPITTNSATSALTMALKLAGVGQGDRVVTTPMTCSASNLPILHLGAIPIWADIDPRTGLIDPESVRKLTKLFEPKAIMAVDWGGQPCDYDALLDAADGVPVIEDAAHSFGAWYKERQVGSIADYTAFSFQAIKHLTTGDGGALTVPTDQVKRAKDMRWFGIDREAPVEFRGELDIDEAGFKFHMNDIAATIGLANLRLIDGILRRHRANAQLYNEQLDDRFVRHTPRYDHQGSWWMYTILLPSAARRNEFRQWMGANKITVSQVHWRNDQLTVFRDFVRPLPGVDEFASRMICLPTHWQTRGWQVVAAANEFWEMD